MSVGMREIVGSFIAGVLLAAGIIFYQFWNGNMFFQRCAVAFPDDKGQQALCISRLKDGLPIKMEPTHG